MLFSFNNFNLMVIYLACCFFNFKQVQSNGDHKSIRPISCSDSKGNSGTCMFSLACRQSKGKPIGICKDTIYAGSCCQLPGDIVKPGYDTGSTLSEMVNFIEKPLVERVNEQSNKSTTTPDTPVHDVTTTTKPTTSTTTTTSLSTSSTPSQTLPTPAAILTTINRTRYMATTLLPLVNSDLNSQDSESETSLPEDLTLSPGDLYPNLNAASGSNDSEPATEFTISFETITEIGFTSTSWNESGTYDYTELSVNDTTVPESSSQSVATESISSSSLGSSSSQQPTSWSSSSVTTTTSSPLNLSSHSVLPAINLSIPISNNVSSGLMATNIAESTASNITISDNTSSSPQSISSSSTLLTTQSSQSTPSTSILNKITTQRPYDNRLDCGVSPLKSMARVVGGRNAHFGEWPWQVLIKEATWLGLWMKTKCGGVLIDHRWVLTAAHCQPGFWGSLLVVVGEYDLTSDVENLKPIQKPVKRMIVHRNYNPLTFENDIALMELESPFDVQPHVVPICLPEPWEDFVGQVAHVAGWGKLSYGGPIPSILQVVKLPILANDVCQEMFNKAGHDKEIKPTFMCAGFNDGGKDSCEGDSGGPLMVQRANGHWVLAGTVSHGIKCAEPNLPGVYMRTTAYRLWIDNIINKTSAKG